MSQKTNLDSKYVKQYMLAGNAIVTLQSGLTGVHITYNIKQHHDNKNVYFVRLLKGPNNEEDYTYIGCCFIL